jgi:hypothetical protein
MQLRTIEANDDTGWGCLACAEGDVVVWNLFEICYGASLWLLGVAAARRGDTRGFFCFWCKAYVCTNYNGQKVAVNI